MELLGDRIREALGERGTWVEEVQLIQASDYASTPEAARQRLGMSPGQTYLLIRVTLRSLDGRPLPLQVDGDHIDDETVAELSVAPGALRVVG